MPDTLAPGNFVADTPASEALGPEQPSPGAAAAAGASEHAGGRAHATCQQATADSARQLLAPMQLAPRLAQRDGSPAGLGAGRQPQTQPAALSETGSARGGSAGGGPAAACALQQAGREGTHQPPAQAAAPHEAGYAVGASAGARPAAASATQHGAGRDVDIPAAAGPRSDHALQPPTGRAPLPGSSGPGSVQSASALAGTAGGSHQAGSAMAPLQDRQAQGLGPAARQKLDDALASSERAMEAMLWTKRELHEMLQKGQGQPLRLQEQAAGGRQHAFGPAATAAGDAEAPVTASSRPQCQSNGPAPAAAAEAASLAASRPESQTCRMRQLPGCDAVPGQEQAAEVASTQSADLGPAAPGAELLALLLQADYDDDGDPLQPAVPDSAEELPDIPDTMKWQPAQECQSAPNAGSMPVRAVQRPPPASQQQHHRDSPAAADLPDIPTRWKRLGRMLGLTAPQLLRLSSGTCLTHWRRHRPGQSFCSGTYCRPWPAISTAGGRWYTPSGRRGATPGTLCCG